MNQNQLTKTCMAITSGPEDEENPDDFWESETTEEEREHWDYDDGFEDEDDTECDLIKEDWRD